MIMTVLLSYIWHSSYEILEYSVWYSWKYGQLNSGITTSWPANQSDAKLLEGAVYFQNHISFIKWAQFFIHVSICLSFVLLND